MGLGAWFWERDQGLLAEAGYASWALDLPGHGALSHLNLSFDEIVEQVLDVVGQLPEPVVVVGHSAGGLVAQRLAGEVALQSVVLLSPAPPAEVAMVPTLSMVKGAASALPAFALRRRVKFPDAAYENAGLSSLEEPERSRVLGQITSWPAKITRSLLFRPSVEPARCPVLVCFGGLDSLIPMRTSRLVGEYHGNAVTWRFDDVGHFAPIEPGGERVARAWIEWIGTPVGRKILEIDPFQPNEGRGSEARMATAPKVRSNSRFGSKGR